MKKWSALLFALTPIMGAFIYCLVSGYHVADLFLPVGWWNDEVVYYKQIESVINYGIPQGFFSYNEVPARVGTFGAWSPAIMLLYVIIGKIVGWNYSMPILINLAIMCFAFGWYGYHIKCDWRVAMGYLLIPAFTRYVVSGMSETIYFASIILWVVSWTRKRKSSWLISFYLTLLRPYFIILFIPLLYEKYIENRKKLLIYMIWPVGAMSIYWFIYNYICAPYFTSIIKTPQLTSLFKGIKKIAEVIRLEFTEANFPGEMYLVFFSIVLILAVMFGKAFVSKDSVVCLERMYILGCNGIILLAILLLYDVNAGSRHLLPFILLDLLFVAHSLASKTGWGIIWVLFCGALLLPKEEYSYQMPIATEEEKELVYNRTEKFEEIFQITENISWENTVIWGLGIDYNVFYSLPAGMGISICEDSYVREAQLKSQYLVVNVNEVFIPQGYEQVYSDITCKVYKRMNNSN